MNPAVFQDAILKWYAAHGRKTLPWQIDRTPYKVFVSEIMLQQTQVATVIPYFNRFLQAFPTIRDLAQASLDDVLHLWTGLGYYARARNLHKTAKLICAHYSEEFPDDLASLCELPGIGRSTAGAILALGFAKPAAILDGNVKRVLARCFAIDGWPGQSKVLQTFWQYAEKYSSHEHPVEYTQAMMDIGAMVCTRSNPDCKACPVQEYCQAFSQHQIEKYPFRKPKKALPTKQKRFLMIRNQDDALLLLKRPQNGIWGGLYSFPECELDACIETFTQQQLGLKCREAHDLAPFRHTFSHYHLEIHPTLLQLRKHTATMEDPNSIWYKANQHNVGLATPVIKLLKQHL